MHPHAIRSGDAVRKQFERETRNMPFAAEPRTMSLRDLLISASIMFVVMSVFVVFVLGMGPGR
jgi:hypothetical protein